MKEKKEKEMRREILQVKLTPLVLVLTSSVHCAGFPIQMRVQNICAFVSKY